MLKLKENAENLRDNKIDPTMRDIDGELDAVRAMVSMGSGPDNDMDTNNDGMISADELSAELEDIRDDL